MSLVQLLTRKGNAIGSVEFDATIFESAKTNSKITSNPVEYGADVNDHIIIGPMEFYIEGLVSNAASGTISQVGAAADQIAAQAGLIRTKSERKWDELLELQASQAVFTLVQGLKSYPNVVIESLEARQDVDTANALPFTARMREFIFVGSSEFPIASYGTQDTADMATQTRQGGVKVLGGR